MTLLHIHASIYLSIHPSLLKPPPALPPSSPGTVPPSITLSLSLFTPSLPAPSLDTFSHLTLPPPPTLLPAVH